MVTVFFICVHNAGRSQMAEAYFNYLALGRRAAISAGSQPSGAINPSVVAVMAEVGIDISGHMPKKLTKEMVLQSDLAVTMGCGEEACPVVPNDLKEWKIDDPHGKSIIEVRRIRDEVKSRVIDLLDKLGQ